MNHKDRTGELISTSDDEILFLVEEVSSPWRNIILRKNLETYEVVIEVSNLINNESMRTILFTSQELESASKVFQEEVTILKTSLGLYHQNSSHTVH